MAQAATSDRTENVSMAKNSSTFLNVRVTGKQMETGEALRRRIDEELSAAVAKYMDRGGDAEVVVAKDRVGVSVEIIMRLGTGQHLTTSASGGDAHAAFSMALEKLEKRVRRYKRRLKNHHPHNGGPRGPAETAPLTVIRGDDVDEDADDSDDSWSADEPNGPPASMVIAETRAEIKNQSVAMAVLELDLTDAPVVLFRNAAHGGLSVVYRRADGNIGWIDPERTKAKPASQASGTA